MGLVLYLLSPIDLIKDFLVKALSLCLISLLGGS
ncbi:DUF1232 domain-containing protein [Capnocytophaga gingivalis]